MNVGDADIDDAENLIDPPVEVSGDVDAAEEATPAGGPVIEPAAGCEASDSVQMGHAPVVTETEAVGGSADEPAKATTAPSTEIPSVEIASAEPGSGMEPTRAGMKWYVLRVASNKEDQVREALERKVRIEKLDDRIGRILVPTAKEKRMKSGKVKVLEKKLYPGYVFVEMATEADGSISDNVWFLVKETLGVGDFIGSDGKPTSMRDHDVDMMLMAVSKDDEDATLQGILEFSKGDKVKIKEGSFQNFEGYVDSLDEAKGIVTVLLTIFGRSTPVDVEYWQLEKL